MIEHTRAIEGTVSQAWIRRRGVLTFALKNQRIAVNRTKWLYELNTEKTVMKYVCDWIGVPAIYTLQALCSAWVKFIGISIEHTAATTEITAGAFLCAIYRRYRRD